MNYFIGNIIEFVHTIFVLVMSYGFILPSPYLKYYLILLPLTFFHWYINNNKCILSELEYKFKGYKKKIISKKNNYPFIKKMYSKFNIHLSNEQIHHFIIMKIIIFWLIGFTRYLKYIQT